MDNSGGNLYESYIMKDVLNLLDSKVYMSGKRKQKALLGVGMGGYGALRIGLKNPDIFGLVGTINT